MSGTSSGQPLIVFVVAIAENGVIGRDNALIWRQRSDLKRFKALTLGCPLLMGRRTYMSIGRPLPGRETIVITRDQDFAREMPDGVHVAFSLDAGLAIARERAAAMGSDRIIVAGGAKIYAQTLAIADRVHLTEIHASPAGDTVFPGWSTDLWPRAGFRETRREDHPSGDGDEFPFSFVDLERIPVSRNQM